MRIDAHFTLAEVDPATLSDASAVVVDVVRATTCIVEALANGALAIYPTESTEEAVRLAQSLGREDALLCGERKGVKVEGFDFGNSPHEFAPDAVAGKKLVMSTTNGTRALGAAAGARRVIVGALTNLGAVAQAVSDDEALALVCAGRNGIFSIDDALCAGHLIRRVVESVPGEHELNDAARAALALAEGQEPTAGFLATTAAGQAIAAIGFEEDLEVCGAVDRHDIVPVLHDQAITLAGA